jgi:Na+-transporting NADH:ubiquinone oxidoreductase subunit F
VAAKYLDEHPSPGSLEFYLCGPPMMIEACKQMLDGLGVARGQIAYDEF